MELCNGIAVNEVAGIEFAVLPFDLRISFDPLMESSPGWPELGEGFASFRV
jgi:hypothetical protein